ncbi:PREDICTED: fibroblast growth factor receptor 3-like [Papilio polytes]|uniref:fibroblast growth factor receptor 3-like n=1 Tax=Papilio polytes TaxID=76194 RepID=UPI000675BF4F|nr:PREDICTED: fibroblast growth factor receptor 3-like [Papilio polytes]XP_013144562.1 PREDICTED: fibroblast growth factor receptor 3-like [Papilio polytes]
MWVALSLAAVAALLPCALGAGYCATDTLRTNTTWMQFTKEPVSFEYGFQDKFKSIHCCVKGYRSIEWFKDGVAYPWSAGVSNLILYPEAANQTLYTRRAARADSGNYTCRLSNETHSETHTVRLDILEKPTDAPRTMFISKDQWVEEGSEVRLYCEALIGRSYLADARSDLRWWKMWPNGTEGDLLPTQQQHKTVRDDVEDIIGAYLVVERVTAQDYGTYVCLVQANDFVSRSYVTLHYKCM